MDTELEDIRSKRSLRTLEQLRDNIIDCAKYIKSDDATFNISTLPTVGHKLTDLMNGYIDTFQKIESAQKAFTALGDIISTEEESRGGDADEEFADLSVYEKKFKDLISKERKKPKSKDLIEAKKALERIISPEEEEIQVEAPQNRTIPKDPISKQDIQFAVKSTVCKHIYDREQIENYINQKEKAKKKVQCPQAGCTNKNMKKSELIEDEELNDLINAM